jgi:hypothetical protein
MCNITVGRYPVPTDEERSAVEAEHPGVEYPSDRWQGWIEPDDLSWIAFVAKDGKPVFFLDREPSGAIRSAA